MNGRNITRQLLLPAAMLFGAAAAVAQPQAAGRWEGVAAVPGAPLTIVVDLAPDGAGWAGAVTLPGRVAKGVAVDGLRVDADGVAFGLAAAMRFSPDPQPRITLRWRTDGALEGELMQAGHVAPLLLRRTGDAQLDRAPAATPLAPAMAGVWRGRFELGGYPRDLTLTLERDAATGAGRGEMLIVGRRTTKLPVDHIVQSAGFITLTHLASELRIEGRWRDGVIDGAFVQGPFESPLTLRRDGGAVR